MGNQNLTMHLAPLPIPELPILQTVVWLCSSTKYAAVRTSSDEAAINYSTSSCLSATATWPLPLPKV